MMWMDWTHLAQDRGQYRSHENILMKLKVSSSDGNVRGVICWVAEERDRFKI
jgi:hypothetical protein